MKDSTNSTDLIDLNKYQEFVKQTDKNVKKGLAGLHFPLLGLFGEVGGLLSELKKKQRDADSYTAYADSVVEEFGDVMWYFTSIAERAGINISTLLQQFSSGVDNLEEAKNSRLRTPSENKTPTSPISNSNFENSALTLAGKVGKLVNEVSTGKTKSKPEILSRHLPEIFRAIVEALVDADIKLEEVIQGNMDKVNSRYPIERKYIPLFDSDFDLDEQLPRKIRMVIEEKRADDKDDRYFVIQKCNGIKIGDRLTDNRAEQDDYRFHDVFHLAYAAILGWSPVTRSLLKLKRKSNPKIDENEDGARAILIEEGVATWVFNHGARLNNYATVKSLDYSLLKAVRELVKGYEVEKCPLWQWEEAILEGFRIFRFLKENRKGLVVADLNKRHISVRRV